MTIVQTTTPTTSPQHAKLECHEFDSTVPGSTFIVVQGEHQCQQVQVTQLKRQGKCQLLHPAPPYYPFPGGNTILGVVYVLYCGLI